MGVGTFSGSRLFYGIWAQSASLLKMKKIQYHIISILLLLNVGKSFAQTDTIIDQLRLRMAPLVEKSLEPGAHKTIRLQTSKYSLDPDTNLLHLLHFYKDPYSGKTFSQYQKEYKNSFPNYGVDPMLPGGSADVFKRQVANDIKKNLDTALINTYDWGKPLQFFITARGDIEFLKNNNLVNLIDSIGGSKGKPGVEYGYPITTFYQLEPVITHKASDSIHIQIDYDYHQIAFPTLFQGNPVLIYPFQHPKLKSNLIVSFVLEGDRLAEPVIIKGDPVVGGKLVIQIQKAFDKGPHEFGLGHIFPSRFYFYVLEND